MSLTRFIRVTLSLTLGYTLASVPLIALASNKDFRGKDLSHKDLANENFGHADLTGANLEWANLQNASFKGANLQNANLSSARLQTADFSEADLRGAKLNKATLESARFTKANLAGEEIFLAYGNAFDEEGNKRARRALEDAGVSTGIMAEHNGELSFKEADLKRAKLHGQLDGVDLRRSDLRGADLSNTKDAEKANLRGAIYDKGTRWPASFDVAESGAVRGEDVAEEAGTGTTSRRADWTGKWMIKAEKGGAAEEGILTIRPDHTYNWDYSAKAEPVDGSWKANGDGLVLTKGESGDDWTLQPEQEHADRPDSAELKASGSKARRWIVPIESK